jgi:hypothetical protein
MGLKNLPMPPLSLYTPELEPTPFSGSGLLQPSPATVVSPLLPPEYEPRPIPTSQLPCRPNATAFGNNKSNNSNRNEKFIDSSNECYGAADPASDLLHRPNDERTITSICTFQLEQCRKHNKQLQESIEKLQQSCEGAFTKIGAMLALGGPSSVSVSSSHWNRW